MQRLRAELGVESIDDLRRVLAEHEAARAEGLRRRSPRRSWPSRWRASRRRGRSTARRSRSRCRWPSASSARMRERARRDPRVVLRVAAPLLARPIGDVDIVVAVGDARPGDGGARGDELRRPRARARRRQDQRRHAPRDAGRPARGGAAPARRGAALLHRLEGAQHQAAHARARARLDAERVRAVRDRRRQGRRQRDRGADLRGAGPAVHPAACCARTAARSRPPRRGALPAADSGASSATSTCTPRCRATAARRWRRWSPAPRRAATGCWPSPTTPRGRCRACRARRLLEQRERFRALQAELGDSLRLLHGVELNIGPDGRARLRPRVPRGSSTGAWPRCTTTSSSIAPRRPSAS